MKNIRILSFVFICIILSNAILDGDNIPKHNSNLPIIGLWQGPHPELSHVSFILNIFEDNNNIIQGKGYWINNNLYQAEFIIDSVSFRNDTVRISINNWGCIFYGTLLKNCSTIQGCFNCEGEIPDNVLLNRIDKNRLYGLFPEHLAKGGSFFYQYTAPERINDGLSVANLSETTLTPEVVFKVVREVATGLYGRIHSFLILKDGKLVCEEYFYGFNNKILHPVESVTKSITSLLLGIAIDQNKISSINDKVLNYFPENGVSLSDKPREIVIKDLLNMTSGLEIDNRELINSSDRISFLLQSKNDNTMDRKFNYSGANTELLGGIIKKATGDFTDVFAQNNLFIPLSITNYRWDQYKQNGYPLCSGSLWLAPRDMVKIGLIVLNGGIWDGKQIISKDWIEKSVRDNVKTSTNFDMYGYQWWISKINVGGNISQFILANGLGSQFIIIFPEYDMVIVTTGGNWEGENDGRSWDLINIIKKYMPILIKKEE